MINMIKKKYILHFLFLFIYFVLSTYSFAAERKKEYKFGYDDQFEVFYSEDSKITYLSNSDDLKLVLKEYKIKENDDYITFEKKGNQFCVSKKTGWLDSIEITNPECFVSSDKLSVGTLTVKDLYESYGHNSRHISMSVIDGQDKLIISYMSELVYRVADKLFSKSIDKSRMPLQRWITFTFDYETQICEKIKIDFVNKNEIYSNFQEYLSEKGFEKVEGFTPSDYYIFKKRKEDDFYVPFTYGEERIIAGQKVVFCYIFTEIGNEMINRYTSISFFDENGNRFEYEKENKEMDLGKTTITWQGKVGHKGSVQYENPILHLWE